MKKLMFCSILSILFINSYSQDTLCSYFVGNIVYEFDYNKDEIIGVEENKNKFYSIDLKYGDILCLDLSDEKKRFRKVILEFFDGEIIQEYLVSEDNVYYTPLGVVKVLVGRPIIFKI